MKTRRLKKLILSVAIVIMTGVFLFAHSTFVLSWEETYDISGYVEYDNGQGISGVSVSCSGGSDTTGLSGSYRIRNLAEGSYTVRASKYGFSFSSQYVTVRYSDKSGVNFTTPTHSVSGYVKYDTGEDVSGVRVSCSYPGGSDTTDLRGFYEIDGLMNDSFTLTPSKSGFKEFSPSSDRITIRGSDETANFTVPTYYISGSVRWEDDLPDGLDGVGIPGITVSCEGVFSRRGGSDTTSPLGWYKIEKLIKDHYTVTPSAAGVTFIPSSSHPIYLSMDQRHVDFKVIVPKYSILGRVTDGTDKPNNGIGGAVVSCSGGSDTTDSSGNYKISNLRSRTAYHLVASKAGYTFGEEYDITLGSEDVVADFAAILCSILGRVTDGTDEPNNGIEGVVVSCSAGEDTTDSSGNYRISDLPVGPEYHLVASKPGYTFREEYDMTLGSEDVVANFTAITYSISGYVKDGRSNPIQGIRVTADGPVTKTTTPGSDGRYEIHGLPKGNYTVNAVEEDNEDLPQD